MALTMELLQQPLTPHPATDADAFNTLCMAPQLTTLLGINQHAGTTWFREEGLATLAGAVALQAVFTSALASPTLEPDFESCAATLRLRLARAAACGCRLDKFLQLG